MAGGGKKAASACRPAGKGRTKKTTKTLKDLEVKRVAGGVKGGESTDKDHKGWIDVLSVSRTGTR